ncbi:tetratricopeptide repeat protein [Fischerella sp. PCC 9605]|uniref:tetratricopeptide repeat protein n=1 Tax=Fischerella sp. PCC 9605 TaxID=1173024 RepID=UPI0004B97C8D|nr:tetratricopeptide repeat protein [Fischerella sp. PCC 9605]
MFDFFKSIEGRITAVITFVTCVVNFVILWQSNAGAVTTVMLSLFVGISWFACGYLYFKKNIIRQPLQPTRKEYAYSRRVRCFAFIGLWAIPLVTIAIFFIVPSLPPQNPIILVADFEGPDPQHYRVTETIIRRLNNAIGTKKYAHVEIKSLGKSITEKQGKKVARNEGEKHKAIIVIWGWYGKTKEVVPISTNFEVLQIPVPKLGEEAKEEPRKPSVAELESFTLQTRLSKDMTYLSLFTLGVARYAAEDWESAINFFNDALRQLQEIEKPESSLNQEIVYLYRGTTYYKQGNYNNAIQDYDWVIDQVKDRVNVNPELAELAINAYYNRGLAFADQYNYRDAIESYSQAIALKSDDKDAYNNRGLAYGKQRNYKAAIEDFDMAIKLNPNLAEAYNNRGFFYAKLGEYDRALIDLKTALELQPEAHVYHSMGFAYAGKGDYKRAIAYYNKALKLNSKLVVIYLDRGRAYKTIGKREKAITDFKQVLESSNDPELQQQATKQLQELGEK